jgi:hypothetical protein
MNSGRRRFAYVSDTVLIATCSMIDFSSGRGSSIAVAPLQATRPVGKPSARVVDERRMRGSDRMQLSESEHCGLRLFAVASAKLRTASTRGAP